MIRQTQALLSKYSNGISRVENKGMWMAGMTPLLFVLLHNIHVAAHFLFNFVFQSDPGKEGSLSDDLGSTLTS